MLNLKPIYEDSLDSLKNGAEALQVNSLPISVFMMQKDVINHYKYAFEHYFDLSLKEPFLQNSSLGSPYDKWRKFANDDFELLFFSIKTLVTFSSRLFHESELRQRLAERDLDNLKMDSNRYTNLICDFKYKKYKLGIIVNEDETLLLSAFHPEGIRVSDNQWSSVKNEVIDISNRAILKEICQRAKKEIGELELINERYKALCQNFCKKFDLFSDYENLHQSYWV